jgi:hypothetical protein
MKRTAAAILVLIPAYAIIRWSIMDAGIKAGATLAEREKAYCSVLPLSSEHFVHHILFLLGISTAALLLVAGKKERGPARTAIVIIAPAETALLLFSLM